LALRRDEKETIVDDMATRLRRAEAVVFTDYRGLSVAQVSQLRRRLRDRGSEFQVVKNTLVRRAFDEVGLPTAEDLFVGPTAVVLLYEDLSGTTKTLLDFAKESNILAIKGGLLGRQALDAKSVAALADLPSREQVQAQLLGVLGAPARQTVSLLAAPARGLLNVLNARAREGGGPAAEAEAAA
jgi:large subunit ribosomal protein L10